MPSYCAHSHIIRRKAFDSKENVPINALRKLVATSEVDNELLSESHNVWCKMDKSAGQEDSLRKEVKNVEIMSQMNDSQSSKNKNVSCNKDITLTGHEKGYHYLDASQEKCKTGLNTSCHSNTIKIVSNGSVPRSDLSNNNPVAAKPPLDKQSKQRLISRVSAAAMTKQVRCPESEDGGKSASRSKRATVREFRRRMRERIAQERRSSTESDTEMVSELVSSDQFIENQKTRNNEILGLTCTLSENIEEVYGESSKVDYWQEYQNKYRQLGINMSPVKNRSISQVPDFKVSHQSAVITNDISRVSSYDSFEDKIELTRLDRYNSLLDSKSYNDFQSTCTEMDKSDAHNVRYDKFTWISQHETEQTCGLSSKPYDTIDTSSSLSLLSSSCLTGSTSQIDANSSKADKPYHHFPSPDALSRPPARARRKGEVIKPTSIELSNLRARRNSKSDPVAADVKSVLIPKVLDVTETQGRDGDGRKRSVSDLGFTSKQSLQTPRTLALLRNPAFRKHVAKTLDLDPDSTEADVKEAIEKRFSQMKEETYHEHGNSQSKLKVNSTKAVAARKLLSSASDLDMHLRKNSSDDCCSDGEQFQRTYMRKSQSEVGLSKLQIPSYEEFRSSRRWKSGQPPTCDRGVTEPIAEETDVSKKDSASISRGIFSDIFSSEGDNSAETKGTNDRSSNTTNIIHKSSKCSKQLQSTMSTPNLMRLHTIFQEENETKQSSLYLESSEKQRAWASRSRSRLNKLDSRSIDDLNKMENCENYSSHTKVLSKSMSCDFGNNSFERHALFANQSTGPGSDYGIVAPKRPKRKKKLLSQSQSLDVNTSSQNTDEKSLKVNKTVSFEMDTIEDRERYLNELLQDNWREKFLTGKSKQNEKTDRGAKLKQTVQIVARDLKDTIKGTITNTVNAANQKIRESTKSSKIDIFTPAIIVHGPKHQERSDISDAQTDDQANMKSILKDQEVKKPRKKRVIKTEEDEVVIDWTCQPEARIHGEVVRMNSVEDDGEVTINRSISDVSELRAEEKRTRSVKEKREKPYHSDPFYRKKALKTRLLQANITEESREDIVSFLSGKGPHDTSSSTYSLTDSGLNDSGNVPELKQSFSSIEFKSLNKVSVEVERADSGVGQETSNTHRPQQGLLCEDCEQVLSTDGPPDDNSLDSLFLCEQCERRRAERKDTIQEIVETEASYGQNLRIIKKEFFDPLSSNGLLTSEQIHSIFINLEELISINESFSEQLQDALDMANDQGDEDYSTVYIGRLFCEATNMLLAFEAYCINQYAAPILLDQLEREKDLLRVFLQVAQNEVSSLRRNDLKSFLMIPVQRIMKYPLLLQRLYKVTSPEHEDREMIATAKQKIEDILQHINFKTKGSSSVRLGKKAAASLLKDAASFENLELNTVAMDTLGWNRNDSHIIVSGRIQFTQASEVAATTRKGRGVKFQQIYGVIVSQGKGATYSECQSAKRYHSEWAVKECALVLVKEKAGKYTQFKDPLMLSKVQVCLDPDVPEVFEVIEMYGETFFLKCDSHEETTIWFNHMRFYVKRLAKWQRRRGGLPNIMIPNFGQDDQ